jgi:hypothetical protein
VHNGTLFLFFFFFETKRTQGPLHKQKQKYNPAQVMGPFFVRPNSILQKFWRGVLAPKTPSGLTRAHPLPLDESDLLDLVQAFPFGTGMSR